MARPSEPDGLRAVNVPRVEGPSLRERLGKFAGKLKRAASLASMVAVVVGSAVGGRGAHHWLTHTARFGAKEIEVLGLQRTLRQDALDAAHIREGTNVLGIDTARSEHLLEELPWIERAKVSRRLPGYVRVELTERTPSALVASGAMYLCGPDGTLFKRLAPGDPTDLPVITGIDRRVFEADAEAAKEYVRDALALLADVAASSLGQRAKVEEVHRDPTGDLSIVLAESGTYVWLGRGSYRARLARLAAILTELDRHHVVAAEIHLESDRHPERATVRLPVAPPAENSPATGHGGREANRGMDLPRQVNAASLSARPETQAHH